MIEAYRLPKIESGLNLRWITNLWRDR